jgi:hypothetical protein
LDTNDISKEFKELNNNIEKIGIIKNKKIDNYEERIRKLKFQTKSLLEQNKRLKEKLQNRTLEKRQQENFNENVRNKGGKKQNEEQNERIKYFLDEDEDEE